MGGKNCQCKITFKYKDIIDVCKSLLLNDSYWIVPKGCDGLFADFNRSVFAIAYINALRKAGNVYSFRYSLWVTISHGWIVPVLLFPGIALSGSFMIVTRSPAFPNSLSGAL